MGRQKTASDEEILQAALRVIVRRGHSGFTLAAVAEEVGLSRAAIILRFKGTQALKVTLTEYMVEAFIGSLRSLPAARSGDALIDLVAFIGGKISGPGNLTAFMRTYHSNIKDDEMAKLELRRGNALRKAISDRMPKVAITHESAVSAFIAHVAGSLMGWEVQTKSDAGTYLVERTREWLTLARVPYDRKASALYKGVSKARVAQVG